MIPWKQVWSVILSLCCVLLGAGYLIVSMLQQSFAQSEEKCFLSAETCRDKLMNCENCGTECTDETKCTCTADSKHCKNCHKDGGEGKDAGEGTGESM